MRYVQRDSDGKICGHFANEQTYAKEILPPDHPEIQEWESKRKEQLSQPTISQRVALLEEQVRELLKRG